MKSFLRYWLPLIVWMTLIFSASADTQSVAHTSRFLGPILRWLNPDISLEAVDTVRWIIRKGAHFTEYAILAWLWWRVFLFQRRISSGRAIAWALAASVLYAMSDEFHQLFVDNRSGTATDVVIDSAGAIFGVGLAWWIWSRRLRSHGQSSARKSVVGSKKVISF